MKVLITKLDHIGDLLLATPVIRAVRKAYPAGYLAVAAARQSAEVIRYNPHLDMVFPFDTYYFRREAATRGVLARNMRSLQAIIEAKFDLVLMLRDDHGNLVFASLCETREIVGHNTNTSFPGLLSRSCKFDNSKAEVDRHFDLLNLLGITPDGRDLDLFVQPEDHSWTEAVFAQFSPPPPGGWVGLFPGGGWRTNWWPWSRFAEVGRRLQAEGDVGVVLVGGHREREVASLIEGRLQGPCLNLVSRTSIHQLGACCQRLRFLVSNDGSPMHVAAAVKAPVVALFGPSPVLRFAPVGDSHIVISSGNEHPQCTQFVHGTFEPEQEDESMRQISVDRVWSACQQMLQRS
jgi:ADP-heptose:LPS heptosyltransferase